MHKLAPARTNVYSKQMTESIKYEDYDGTPSDTSLVIRLIVIVYVILNVILFMYLHTLVESKL